jgi:transcriptional regulator with XRE-family HTH domain
MDIGFAIRDLRRGQNITLKEVAEKTKLSVSQLSSMETGRRKVSMDALKLIAAAIDIPVPVIVYWGSKPGELADFSKEAEKSMNDVVSRILRDRAARRHAETV